MSHNKQEIRPRIRPHLCQWRDDLERAAGDPDLTDKERYGSAQRAFAATTALDEGCISSDIIEQLMNEFGDLTETQAANIVAELRGAVDQMPFQQVSVG